MQRRSGALGLSLPDGGDRGDAFPRLFMQLVEHLGGDIRAVLPDEAIARQVGRRCGDTGALRLESRFPERNAN